MKLLGREDMENKEAERQRIARHALLGQLPGGENAILRSQRRLYRHRLVAAERRGHWLLQDEPEPSVHPDIC